MSECKDRPSAKSIALAVAILTSSLVTPFVTPTSAQAQGAAAGATSWTTYKGDLQRTGSSTTPLSMPLNLMWRHTVSLEQGYIPESNSTSPLVVGPEGARRVYVAIGRQILSIDGQTGEKIWSQPRILDGRVRAPLTLMSSGDAGDVILAALETGALVAVQTSDGSILWEVNTVAPALRAPVVVNTTGGERIIVALTTGEMKAYTRDGKQDLKWTGLLGRAGTSPMTSPLLSTDGKRMFLAGSDQTLYAINVDTGKTEFSTGLGAPPSDTPALLGTRIIMPVSENVVALQQRGGGVAWTAPANGRILGSPAGSVNAQGKGAVYVGTDKGILTALNVQTGAQLWKADLGAQVTGSPLVLPNAVLVGTKDGVFFAVKPENGEIIWRYRLHTEREIAVAVGMGGMQGRGGRGMGGRGMGGGRGRRGNNQMAPGMFGGGRRFGGMTETRTFGVSSAPAIAGNQLFLLTDNAALYAFDAMPFDADPPRVVEPSITVRSIEKTDYAQLMEGGRPLNLPGRAPVYFAAQIEDRGSGVDPASVKVTMNNRELAADAYYFLPATGVVTATLAEYKNGTANNLPDGIVSIGVQARDYRGNAMNFSSSFQVNNDAQPPSDPFAPQVITAPSGLPGAMPGQFPGGDPNANANDNDDPNAPADTPRVRRRRGSNQNPTGGQQRGDN